MADPLTADSTTQRLQPISNAVSLQHNLSFSVGLRSHRLSSMGLMIVAMGMATNLTPDNCFPIDSASIRLIVRPDENVGLRTGYLRCLCEPKG